jgi:hypothetical protein
LLLVVPVSVVTFPFGEVTVTVTFVPASAELPASTLAVIVTVWFGSQLNSFVLSVTVALVVVGVEIT